MKVAGFRLQGSGLNVLIGFRCGKLREVGQGIDTELTSSNCPKHMQPNLAPKTGAWTSYAAWDPFPVCTYTTLAPIYVHLIGLTYISPIDGYLHKYSTILGWIHGVRHVRAPKLP